MRDTLPLLPRLHECGVINLDVMSGYGTHWVAYKKHYNKVFYFDSFGDLRPPQEVEKYFHGCVIKYNYVREQKFNTIICGHLCLKFLYEDQ